MIIILAGARVMALGPTVGAPTLTPIMGGIVIGLAWRGWLLLYTLPYLISATRTRRTGESADRAGRS